MSNHKGRKDGYEEKMGKKRELGRKCRRQKDGIMDDKQINQTSATRR
jgi:hypothetical protein